MKMSFRWYGEDDKIPLSHIKQIPNIHGIVSAIYDVPVGGIWGVDKIQRLKSQVEGAGLKLEVIESVPVHEDIKLGLNSRDKYIENYCQNVKDLGAAGIKVICYNFMPVFDWLRTNLSMELPDGSNCLSYEDNLVKAFDPTKESLDLPGWDKSYTSEQLQGILGMYKNVDEEKLWENLEYFLKKVIPVAKEAKVRFAIHPDDPPWSIFGLPRIITNAANIRRCLSLVDDEYNGLTFCTGSLGADENNDLAGMLREFWDKVPFIHLRNIKRTGEKDFHETSHYSKDGSVDMFEIIEECFMNDFSGYIRPDHGRMIWGETGKAGYGLYDRALGITYFNGLYEGIAKSNLVSWKTKGW